MKQTPVRNTLVPAVDAEWPDPFAWPRMPTPPLVQVPFNFEDIEEEGNTLCE